MRRTVAFATMVLLGLPHARAAFQESLWGARPASLAGVYTALADDANAPAYNPAGISLMQRSEVTLMFARLYSGINFNAGTESSDLGLGYLSFVPKVMDNRYGTFGVSWANFRATSLYREDSFLLSYANNISLPILKPAAYFAYGANLKYLRRDITEDSRTDLDPVFSGGGESDAVSADLGLLYHPNFSLAPGLKFGASALNITEPDIGLASSDRIPAQYTLGVGYQDDDLRWFNPAIDVSRRDGRTVVGGAWEGWFVGDTLALRAGGDEDQFSGGLGYQFRLTQSIVIRLDYAILLPLKVEGSDGSHRISLTTSY